MKKILISVVISLCFFNSAISEVVILRCESVSIKEKKDGKLINKPNNWYSIFKVDLKNNYYERDDDGYKNYFINYNDKLLKYSIWNSSSSSLLGTSFPYRISFGHISRVTGEWIYKSMYISNNDYENLKIKIDNINNNIANFEPYDGGGIILYNVSTTTSKEKEFQKYKIIKEMYELNTLQNDYTEGFWTCEKKQKAF